jgi:hypothetical protein
MFHIWVPSLCRLAAHSQRRQPARNRCRPLRVRRPRACSRQPTASRRRPTARARSPPRRACFRPALARSHTCTHTLSTCTHTLSTCTHTLSTYTRMFSICIAAPPTNIRPVFRDLPMKSGDFPWLMPHPGGSPTVREGVHQATHRALPNGRATAPTSPRRSSCQNFCLT